MMKTKFFYVAALILGLAFTTTSCSSDDDNPTVDPANIDYTPENASSWHNYMRNVAALLKQMQPISTTHGIQAIKEVKAMLPCSRLIVPLLTQAP